MGHYTDTSALVSCRTLRKTSASSMAKQALYKIVFVNQSQVFELYARQIFQSDLYGFIEIEDYVFGEKSAMIVDPAEEKLKNEFNGVKRSFIPLHAIVRIDEVEKESSCAHDRGKARLQRHPLSLHAAPTARLDARFRRVRSSPSNGFFLSARQLSRAISCLRALHCSCSA